VIVQKRDWKDRHRRRPELYLILAVAVAFAAAPDVAHAQKIVHHMIMDARGESHRGSRSI
jgi:hypothetical protein